VADWAACAARLRARHDEGLARLPDEPARRERALVRLGNVAAAAGLCELMGGEVEAAGDLLLRAAEYYRESHAGAPPDAWGRPLGALKARLIAGDAAGAEADARWTLELGAESASPVGRYAAALALVALGEDGRALALAESLRGSDFPREVADALHALASSDAGRYGEALGRVVASFEERTAFIEDVPVADTVLALEALAAARGMAVRPSSRVLPSG
jgi:hypothetical protein